MFNMQHTKARNMIERAFAVVKMRWGILRSASYYPIRTQIRLILSCFLLHNFIRGEMIVDPIEQELDGDFEAPNIGAENDEPVYIDTVEPTPAWNNKRNGLAETMWLNFLEHRYLSFKALVKEDGMQWDVGANLVIASDETWASIFKKNKLASAYYYEGEPEFNRLSVMFGPKKIKEEKMDAVIVLSDDMIPTASTVLIIPDGIADEAAAVLSPTIPKGPKSRRKLFDETTHAGDRESTNMRHYYIMGPNGELERKMFSPKPLKNDGRPPIPNASSGGSSCASSASPVGWRRK